MNASVACSHEQKRVVVVVVVVVQLSKREEAKQNGGEGSARAFIYFFVNMNECVSCVLS